MAALELRIISEILREKDMATVQALGFNSDHLAGDPEAAQIFDFIRAHYHHPDTRRELPSVREIARRWPSFKMTAKTDDGLRTLLQECKGLRLEADVRSLADYFHELVEDDPQQAIAMMQSQLARLSYRNKPSTGFSVREVADTVREQYLGAQSGAIYGIPWPWEPLTSDTLGKNPEDFIILYGRMKSMKTWILLKSAMDDYILHRKRVLVWSREMNRVRMALRSGSILGGVDYQCLKKGTLPAPMYQRAQMALDAMAMTMEANKEALEKIRKGTYEYKDVPDLMFVSGRGAPLDLESLDIIVEAFAPDVVYLDSMYHLNTVAGAKARSETERQRALAVSVKQRAIDWAVPVVGAIQGNRDAEKTSGETLADIGWTDSFAQEGDLILRVNYAMGRAPFEAEYEGHWEKLKKKMGSSREAKERRRGRMRIAMSEKAREKFARRHENGVPGKVMAKIREMAPDTERKSATIYLMCGGNRDGVLEGIQISCIPGYCFDYVKTVTQKEVSEIFEPEKKKKGKGGGGKRREQEVVPAQAGMNWGDEGD